MQHETIAASQSVPTLLRMPALSLAALGVATSVSATRAKSQRARGDDCAARENSPELLLRLFIPRLLCHCDANRRKE